MRGSSEGGGGGGAGAKREAVRSAEKSRTSTCGFADRIARESIAEYQRRRGAVEFQGVQTVLAAILSHDRETDKLRVLSMGVGTKVLSSDMLASDSLGQRVHDCHAEVLARRSLLRVLYSELSRSSSAHDPQRLLQAHCGRRRLRDGVTLHMYTSSQPCGNATLKRWARCSKEAYQHNLPQHEWVGAHHARMQMQARHEGQVALLVKCSSARQDTDEGGQEDAGDGGRYGRGKESCGRGGMVAPGTAEPSSGRGHSMTCSDKIAMWNVVGLQGGLLARWLDPIFLSTCTVGRKYSRLHLERAVCCRLQDFTPERVPGLSGLGGWGGGVRHLGTMCTSVKLDTGAISTAQGAGASFGEGACLCWAVGDEKCEIIQGRTGMCVCEGGADAESAVSQVSKRALFKLYLQTAMSEEDGERPTLPCSYLDAKRAATHYRRAKDLLTGNDLFFKEWLRSDPEAHSFVLELDGVKSGSAHFLGRP